MTIALNLLQSECMAVILYYLSVYTISMPPAALLCGSALGESRKCYWTSGMVNCKMPVYHLRQIVSVQALLAILDSPLAKSGHLKVASPNFVHLTYHWLINCLLAPVIRL